MQSSEHGGRCRDTSRTNTNPVVGKHPDECLWSADDVANYLKTSRSWVYHRAELGLLPHVRIGRLLRFHPSEIRACVGAER
jgi:excisionase family DNA binding protein